jgi:tetratricopeptide (TPR) repeat protein
MQIRCIQHVLLGLFCVLTLTAHADDAALPPPTEECLRLQGRDVCYSDSLQLEAMQAGDPNFDIPLAQAALRAGNFDEAYAIFERVVTVDPRHAAAWMELARLDAARGDRDALWQHSVILEQLSPPDAARAQLRQWLVALGLAPAAGHHMHLAASGGIDTNANLGTDLSRFGTFEVDESSRTQDSAVLETRLIAQTVWHDGGHVAATLGAQLGQRQFDESLDPQNSVAVSGVLAWTRARSRWELGLAGGLYLADDNRIRTLGLQFGHDWTPSAWNRWQLQLGATVLDFDGPPAVGNPARGDVSARSRIRYALTGSMQHRLRRAPGKGASLLAGSLKTYAEEPTSALSKDESTGARGSFTASHSLHATLATRAFVDFDYRYYDQLFAGSDRGEKRRVDRSSSVGVQLNWQPTSRWPLTLNAKSLLQKRASSVAIFDYERVLWTLGFSWRIF